MHHHSLHINLYLVIQFNLVCNNGLISMAFMAELMQIMWDLKKHNCFIVLLFLIDFYVGLT